MISIVLETLILNILLICFVLICNSTLSYIPFLVTVAFNYQAICQLHGKHVFLDSMKDANFLKCNYICI